MFNKKLFNELKNEKILLVICMQINSEIKNA